MNKGMWTGCTFLEDSLKITLLFSPKHIRIQSPEVDDSQENLSTTDYKGINKGDITELKSQLHPPQLVKIVLEGVAILLNRQTD